MATTNGESLLWHLHGASIPATTWQANARLCALDRNISAARPKGDARQEPDNIEGVRGPYVRVGMAGAVEGDPQVRGTATSAPLGVPDDP